MKRFSLFLIVPVLVLCISSCTGKQKKQAVATANTDSLEVKYATGFSVYYTEKYKQVVVHNPWEKGKVYATYYLVEDNDIETPADGVKVLIPVHSLAAASVTHFEFLNLLDELHTVTGVCQPHLIYNETLRNKAASGEIADLGDAFQIDIENTLHLHPDAVMMSGLNQKDANAQRILQAGIPVVYNNEWTETSLLGRAEWIKFVSVFYNKEAVADSVFRDIENRYSQVSEMARMVEEKPSVMMGANFRGTWYMPAGHSFMGQLLNDGGASYFYANDTTTGSLPLNVETVLMNFADTDYWLNCNYNTLEELLNADKKHGLFKPVKLGRVYNFNKRVLSSGANDFWESGVARPDLLLCDVIAILHPGILSDYELTYAEKLK